MSKVIEVKQAKPTEEDYECFLDFMYGLERMLEHRLHPDRDRDEDIDTNWIDENLRYWIESQWENRSKPHDVSCVWQRVFYAGQCAVENSCDPSKDVLEWRPEIQQALDFYEAHGPKVMQ